MAASSFRTCLKPVRGLFLGRDIAFARDYPVLCLPFGAGHLPLACRRIVVHCTGNLLPPDGRSLSLEFRKGKYWIARAFRASISRRCFLRPVSLGQDSSYEYDPKTNTFRQKLQLGSYQATEQQRVPGSAKQGWRGFIWRFVKTLFMITGGITWGGILFLAFFVDRIEVEDGETELSDGEESKLRLLAFYDVLKAKKDVLSLLVKGKRSDVEKEMSKKEEAFLTVWDKLRTEEGILNALGKPVQLIGYRAAEKLNVALLRLGDMAQSAERTAGESTSEVTLKSNSWAPVCIVEGANCTALLSLLFERESHGSEWILVRVHLETLKESGDILCNLVGTLPKGLTNYTRFSN